MDTYVHRALRVVLLLAALLSIATPAYAYLDPGTGSMILSAVIGVAAAVGLALKMFWYRVLSVFRGGRREPRPGTEGRPAADQ
jgi:hypothetical protein